MENDLTKIERSNIDRRRIEQASGLSRRDGERRRKALDEGMRELRVSTRLHLAIRAAELAALDVEITDWQARYHAARRAI